MKKFVIAIAVSTTSLLSACAVIPNYTAPSKNEFILNTVEIQKSFDESWIALVEYSAKSFFAIKNFEKESGLLTLSFGAGNPSKFVDCGSIDSTMKNYNGPFVERVGALVPNSNTELEPERQN